MVVSNTTNNLLTALGLTDNELTLYRAYLKYGEKSAAEISRLIGMDKSSAYRAVENLVSKRLLVTDLKKKGTTYRAAHPEVLRDVYSSIKIELESQKNGIDLFIDELKKQENVSNRSTYIMVEKGLSSLQFRMTESLGSLDKFIREKFSDKHKFFKDKSHAKFVIDYAKKRAGQKIKIVQLEEKGWSPDTTGLEDVMVNQTKYFKEIRILPDDAKWGENSFRIWDNTINIVSFDDKGEFIVITIRDPFVVRLMQDMYDFIWRRSKPV